MLNTHVLRRLGFEMHFVIKYQIQMHTHQTQKTSAWNQVCRLRKVALSLAGARRSVGDICSQVSLHFLCHGDAAAVITHISVWLTPKGYVLRNYSAPVTGALFEALSAQSIGQRTSCVHYAASRSKPGPAVHRVP